MSENNNVINDRGTYSYIALGSFDGLHKGHLSLVKKIIELSRKNTGKSILYTFKNHPRSIIKADNSLKLIIDNDTKVEILSELGVDEVYFEEFNSDFMKYSPEEFIEYLCHKFNVKGIVVGFNYKFGYKNLGDVQLLEKLSSKYKYDLHVIKPCMYEDEVVSSTRIRNAILDGDVEMAYKMLTRPFSIGGIVVHGKKIGRELGFPTANLQYSSRFIIPKNGVYYTNVKLNNKIYKGISNIGYNPTVNGSTLTLETYILDFSGDAYGEELRVYFIKKLRDEKKFKSKEELIKQLEKDKFYAKQEKLYVH